MNINIKNANAAKEMINIEKKGNQFTIFPCFNGIVNFNSLRIVLRDIKKEVDETCIQSNNINILLDNDCKINPKIKDVVTKIISEELKLRVSVLNETI